jgi:hypothetical protein
MAEMEKKGRRREEESGVWLSIDKGGVNKHLDRGLSLCLLCNGDFQSERALEGFRNRTL